MIKRFTIYHQHDSSDCGAACLRMIARHYGRYYSLEHLRRLANQGREEVSLLDISDAAEKIGLRTLAGKVTYEQLANELILPVIVHWRQNHYIVVYAINDKYVWVADPNPEAGKLQMLKEEFLDGWISDAEGDEQLGVVLVLEPGPDFHAQKGQLPQKNLLKYLWTYLRPYKNLLWQLGVGLTLVLVLQALFPFLIKSVVDEGVGTLDFNFVLLVLVAWLILYLSKTLVEHVRAWILTHIGTRMGIRLLSDFLIKVVRLPLSFFDRKNTADVLRRIRDNQRIEQLLTTSSLLSLFSFVSVLILGVLLLYFNLTVFWIFLFGTAVYVLWVARFMQVRKELDYIRFDQASENQIKLEELIHGIEDIKLNNAETDKRWDWERTEAELFRTGMNYRSLHLRQDLGARIIDEVKNIFITVFAAKAVIDGQLSIGGLLAVQYIVGQLQAPIQQLIHFLRMVQDARISLERMQEVQQMAGEEEAEAQADILPDALSLKMVNVTFSYRQGQGAPALKDISVEIPSGKTTAIVGSSGSGKTTLMKLLLGMYQPQEGEVKLGEMPLRNIPSRRWNELCGVVLQDGYIFSDTVARNICLGEDSIDEERLKWAARIANIHGFVESLPLGYNTRLGAEGLGLSQGQRQRILIARAVYKKPSLLFFDEATNALDAYNELIVLENVEDAFPHATTVLIAHRLSTVMNADYIIVLEDGELIEQGTHDELTNARGTYYHLLKNQLELGA